MKKQENGQILFNWLAFMNKNQEAVFCALSTDMFNNICIYTTIENPEEFKKQIRHLLYLLDNSKESIKL